MPENQNVPEVPEQPKWRRFVPQLSPNAKRVAKGAAAAGILGTAFVLGARANERNHDADTEDELSQDETDS